MPFRKSRQPLLICPESPSLDWGDPINKSLVGYWPLNEPGGLKAFDATGGGAHLTLHNGTTRVAGSRMTGRSTHLTSASNQWYQGAFRHAPGPAITLCGWVVLDAYVSGHALITLGTGGTDGIANLVIYPGSQNVLWGNASDDNVWGLPTDTTGRRVFLCGTEANFNYMFYFQGRYIGTRVGASTGFQGGPDIFVGTRADGFAPMNGSVQNIRVYNRALTPPEILRLYQEPWAGVLPARRRISSTGAVVAPAVDELLFHPVF